MADTNKDLYAYPNNPGSNPASQLINQPFIWVNEKTSAFAYSAKEIDGVGTYAYHYTGYLNSIYTSGDTDYRNSIIFIKDTNEIWARGQFFGLSAESVATINANFNTLNTNVNTLSTNVTQIQNAYVTGLTSGSGTGPFIKSFEHNGNTYTYTFGNISFGSGSGAASKTITSAVVDNTGKITFTYNNIGITINVTPNTDTDNYKPIVDIVSGDGTNTITYETGKIGYEYVRIDGSQDLPAYLANMKSDISTLTSSGVIYKGDITGINGNGTYADLPTSNVTVGDMYIWKKDNTTYNTGDILIAYKGGNNPEWAVVEHNIDDTAINNAVTFTDGTHELGKTDTTIATIAGHNIQAKVPEATTSTYGTILVAGKTTQNVTLSAGASTGKFYGVYTGAKGVAYVNVPWTDTHTSIDTNTGQIVTGLSISNDKITASYTSLSAEQKTTGTGVHVGNNAYIKIGTAEIGITGNNDITVTYNASNDKNIQISYSHGLSTVTTGTTTNHDTVASSNFNKAVSGISVSAHQITPTYTIIASYTYIENQKQLAYDYADSVATEAAALKWVVI